MSLDIDSRRYIIDPGCWYEDLHPAPEHRMMLHLNGQIESKTGDGEVLPEPVTVARGLVCPEGVAVDVDGSLLIVESEVGRLPRVDPSTGVVTTVVSGLPRCLQADHPTWIFNGVAVGPSGTVFLTSDSENLLFRIEPDR